MEEWRAIPGLEGFEASNGGQIRRVGSGRMYKGYAVPRGYPYVTLSSAKPRMRRRFFVHVLVAKAFLGDCPVGYEHNHKDGNKLNAKPENLEFVTRSQNLKHKHAVLGYPTQQGSKHGMAKLTESHVKTIRARRTRGDLLSALARDFGVNVPTISMIVNRRTWRHVPDAQGQTI